MKYLVIRYFNIFKRANKIIILLLLTVSFFIFCSSAKLTLKRRHHHAPSLKEVLQYSSIVLTFKNPIAEGVNLTNRYIPDLENKLHLKILNVEHLNKIDKFKELLSSPADTLSLFPDTAGKIASKTGKKYLIINEVGFKRISGRKRWLIAPIIFILILTKPAEYQHPYSNYTIIDLSRNEIIFSAYYQSDEEAIEFTKNALKYFWDGLKNLKGES